MIRRIAGCGRIAHIWQQGRAVYLSLFSDLMPSLFDINVPVLELEPSRCAAGELSRFAGTYAWPDRSVKVLATDDGLVIADEPARSIRSPSPVGPSSSMPVT